MKIQSIILLWLLSCGSLFATRVNEKILIAGICRDAEAGFDVVRCCATLLGEYFEDYHVVIYENNSKDATKQLYSNLAKEDSRVTFISEDLTFHKLRTDNEMGVWYRTGTYARARNKVLDVVFSPQFSDYKYLVMADTDFLDPWDIEAILETILHPECDWDAVFSRGAYDLFAFRSDEFPVGFELLGEMFLKNLDEERKHFHEISYFNRNNPWIPVYSGFGGIAIYKIASIKGCRYSGVVTKALERQTEIWIDKTLRKLGIPFTLEEVNDLALNKALLLEDDLLKIYESLENYHLLRKYIFTLFEVDHFYTTENRFLQRKSIDDEYIALKMNNAFSEGRINWLSCGKDENLPWTCEHVTFHAAMIENGHDKLYMNPKWHSHHP